jgi:hypothetical protein
VTGTRQKADQLHSGRHAPKPAPPATGAARHVAH